MSKRLREWRLSRARAARAERPAPPPDPTEEFAKQAHDLDALRKTVEDAAAVSAGFWLSYLFVLFYIAIAAGAVTHKDLLLENPVKLPFLNVELPLVAFFFLAPILFIVSHAYTLMHYVMLAAKAGVFNNELGKHLRDSPEKSEGLRQQLPSNVFVQLCAGPSDIRKGGLGWLLKAIAWVSLVIGPVLLLLLIQAQFLPYHLEWVTWVQRAAIVADVILLWLLWPAVLNGRSRLMWRLERRGKGWPGVLALTGRYIAGLTACLIPIGLAFTAATFPGEWMDDWIGEWQWIPPNPVTAKLGLERKDLRQQPLWTSFQYILFNGDVDHVTRRRKSLFSNTLVLPGFDALEAAKLGNPNELWSVKHTLSLRGRHLESAIFYSADLRKADLEGARLQSAVLVDAGLQGASLFGTEFQGVSPNFAELRSEPLHSKDEFAALKLMIMKEVPKGSRREGALKRIEEWNPDRIFLPEVNVSETFEKGRVYKPAFQEASMDQPQSLACPGDTDNPYKNRLPYFVDVAYASPFTGDVAARLFARGCPRTAQIEQGKPYLSGDMSDIRQKFLADKQFLAVHAAQE
jgi:Pentapeptide repeats (8 copies)